MGESILEIRLKHIHEQIQQAATAAGRPVSEINLLAVSKGQPIERIQQAYRLGINNFGENYWQEASFKIKALQSLPIHWHFLGRLQTNKIKAIANHFDWIHSVSREVEIEALARFRSPARPPLQLCLEVNIEGALGKNGVKEADLLSVAKGVVCFPNLRLRGLMIILNPVMKDQQKQIFEKTRSLLSRLNQVGFDCDTLSMGMSGDFLAAIQAGSTWVRLGQALFGPRANS